MATTVHVLCYKSKTLSNGEHPLMIRINSVKPKTVLYALQLDDDILYLAKDDELGRALQDMNLPQRERASKKE